MSIPAEIKNDRKQIKSYLTALETPTSSASIELEEVGYTILRNIFNKDELEALRKEIIKIYAEDECSLKQDLRRLKMILKRLQSEP